MLRPKMKPIHTILQRWVFPAVNVNESKLNCAE